MRLVPDRWPASRLGVALAAGAVAVAGAASYADAQGAPADDTEAARTTTSGDTDVVATERQQAAALGAQAEDELNELGVAQRDGYAGAWLDPTGAGHVYIGFAGGAADRARADIALKSLVGNSRVTFVERRFSLAELHDGMVRAVGAAQGILAGGGAPTGLEAWVDVEKNDAGAGRAGVLTRFALGGKRVGGE